MEVFLQYPLPSTWIQYGQKPMDTSSWRAEAAGAPIGDKDTLPWQSSAVTPKLLECSCTAQAGWRRCGLPPNTFAPLMTLQFDSWTLGRLEHRMWCRTWGKTKRNLHLDLPMKGNHCKLRFTRLLAIKNNIMLSPPLSFCHALAIWCCRYSVSPYFATPFILLAANTVWSDWKSHSGADLGLKCLLFTTGVLLALQIA